MSDANNSGRAGFDLLPEDDALLNYFLSTNTSDDNVSMINAAAPAFASFVADSGNEASLGFDGQLLQPKTVTQPVSVLQQMQAEQQMLAQKDAASMSAAKSSVNNSELKGEADTDEKRERRLARNRESARQSRRRKKQYLELLEEKVSQLTDEIDAARRQHIEGAETSLCQMKSKYVMALYQQASQPNLSPEEVRRIEAGVTLLQQRFGPDNPERRAVMEYEFQQLNNLLLPPYTKFLLWLSIQDASFFSTDEGAGKLNDEDKDCETKEVMVDHKDLWAALINDLGLSYEQQESLTSLYASSQSEDTRMERIKIALAMSYLNRLGKTVGERAKSIQSHTDSLQSILTPIQSVKFMSWLKQNHEGIVYQNLHGSSSEHDSVSDILKKPDEDVTVEDVTELLAALT